MIKIKPILTFIFIFTIHLASSQNYVIDPTADGGFEGNHGWTILNTSNVNKWIIGTTEKTAGVNGAYVSDNNSTNTVTNPQATNSKIYIYKDVVVPINATSISISFKYKNAGNDAPKPRCMFELASAFPALPTSGNLTLNGAEFTTFLSNASNWTSYTNTTPFSSDRSIKYTSGQLSPGETYRIIFEWTAANQTSFVQTSPITKYPTGGAIQSSGPFYTPGGTLDHTLITNNDGNNFGLEWSVDGGAQIISGQGTSTIGVFYPLGTSGTVYTSLRYTFPTPTLVSNGKNSGPLAIDEVAITYAATPKITSFAPASGAVGSSVTLSGQFFGATIATNTVYLGGVKCAFTAASATSITVTVPANASLGNFTVLNTSTNLSYASGAKFVPINTALAGMRYNSNTLTSFETPITFTTGTFGSSLDQKFVLADVDLDGKVDIFSYNSSGIPQVLRNTATSGIVNASTFASNLAISGVSATSPTSRNTLTADLNNDGKLDFATNFDSLANGGFANINTSVSGTPSLQAFSSLLSTTNQYKTNASFLPLDINLDGRIDIIGLNGLNSGQALLYFTKNNTIGTTFSSVTGNTANTDSFNQRLSDTNFTTGASGDLDGDGKVDVVLGGTGKVYVLKNTTRQGNQDVKSFRFSEPVSKSIAGGAANTVKLADFDVDGKLDIIATNSTTGTISVYKNNSSVGDIAITDAQNIQITGLSSTIGLAIADMNGDGKPDVVVSNNSTAISYLQNTSVPGTISFATAVTVVSSGAYSQLEIADVDGDNKPDIIAANNTNGIVVFRNRVAEAGTITADQTICSSTIPAPLTSGSPATFSTAGTITYKWQSSTNGTSSWTDIANSNTLGYTITAALTATTYYRRAAALSTAPTVFYFTNPVMITVTSLPTITAPIPATGCGTTTVTLGATSSGGVVKWYSALTGGTLLGTGNTFTTPAISSTTDYYASAESVTGCVASALRTTVTATIITVVPVINTPGNNARCDAGSLTITPVLSAATAFGSTLNWYAAPMGGSPIGTGPSFTTPEITSTTTFYADATNCNGTSARTAFVATIVATPNVLSTTSNIGCKGTNVLLSAVPSAGSVLYWYTTETGGSQSSLHATVSNIPANTTRYVSAAFTANGVTCESPRTAVVATMFAVPVAPTAIHTTLCGIGNTATVSVTPPANTVVNWFSALSGGISLGTGNSYTTPVLTAASTVSYYASVTDVNGCVSSPRTKVDVVYNGPTVTTIASVNAITNSAVTFSANIANQTTFNWQRSTDNGLNWVDITASLDPNVTYSGFSGTTATTTTLTINTAVPFIHKYQYRLKLIKSAGCVNYSNTAILNVADVFGGCKSSVAAVPTGFGVNTTVTTSWVIYEKVYNYPAYDSNGINWSIDYLERNTYTQTFPSLSDRSLRNGIPDPYRDSDIGSSTGLIVQNSAAGQAYITLDLGGSKLINRVDLAGLSKWNPYAGTDIGYDNPIVNLSGSVVLIRKTGAIENSYDAEGGSVQVSTDGNTWSTVVSNISGTRWLGNDTTFEQGYGSFNFTAVNARYVRVQNNRVLGLSEFKIFPVDLVNTPYIRKAPQAINYVSAGGTFNLSVPVSTRTGCESYEWSYSADNTTFITISNNPDLSIAAFNSDPTNNPQIGFYRLTATDCNECSLSVTFELRQATSYYTSDSGSNAMQTLSSWKTGTTGTTGTAPPNFTTAANVFVLANSASTYSSGAIYSNLGSLRLNGKIATLGNFDATWGAVLESSASSNPQSYVKTNGTGALKISTSAVPTLFPVGNSTYNAVTLTNNTGTVDTYSASVSDAVLTSGTTGAAMNNVVNRTWKIAKTVANTAGYGTDLTFEWNSSDITGLVVDPILYAFVSGSWVEQTVGSITRTSNSVTFNKYTGPLSSTLFMLSNAVPVITSFTPGSMGNSGSVIITGKALSNATGVSFGGVSATSFVVNSPTQITAIVSTGATGTVSVTTSAGTATLAGFTFVPAPTITSFTPTNTNRATTLTITGTNFNNATSVSLGGTAAISFTIVNSTTITAVVGAGTTGTISVITPGGTATATGFVYGNTTPLDPTIGSIANIVKIFNDPSFALPLPTSNSNGLFTYSSSDLSVISINGTIAVINGPGVATITATQAATDDFNTGNITFTITVNSSPVLYMSNLAATTSDGTIVLSAISNSQGAITYSSGTTGVATISGSTLTVVGAGTSIITITQAANGNYTAATSTAVITVRTALLTNPTLTNFANINKMMSNPAFVVTPPMSNSAGAFTYISSNPRVATISSPIISLRGPGISIITAVQAANGIYSASSISAILIVGQTSKLNPEISGLIPITKFVTDVPFAINTATSTSPQQIIYISSTPSVATIATNTATLKGLGISNIIAFQEATSSYNSGSLSTSLTVVNQLPIISYSTPIILTKGTAISNINPTSTGGVIASFTISPSLPLGLSFNTTTGVISGTPIVVAASNSFTITANNSSGNATVTIQLSVVDIAPSGLSYAAPPSFSVGSTIATRVPINTGSPLTSFSISPSLPGGLIFNTTTGEISGTPAAAKVTTTYTITGTNSGGIVATTIGITVNDSSPLELDYTTPIVLLRGVLLNPITPSNSGGAIASYAISPGLSAGLSFDTTTGFISGRPTVAAATTDYTITGTNTGGTVSKTISVFVNDNEPTDLSYPTPNVFLINVAITNLQPTVYGGAVTRYAIDKALPTGLSFDTSTGIISGTPTQITTTETYIVTAFNFMGSSSFSLDITIGAPPTNLSYSATNNFYINTPITGISPTITSTPSAVFSISPALPAGLILNTTTGEITGTPSVLQSSTNYSITANNGFAPNSTFNFSIVINKGTPTIASIPAITKTFGAAAFALTDPTSTSTGSFTYASSDLNVATVSGNTITIVGAGTATITGTQAVDANYISGTTTALLTVNQATPTIASILDIIKTFGDAAFALTDPSSTSTGSFTYASSDLNVATVSGNTITIVGAGTATITGTQAVDANYTSGTTTAVLTVNSTTPSAVNALSVTAGNAEVTVAFTGGSAGGSAIVNYQYSLDGGLSWMTFSPALTTSPVTITGLTNGTSYSIQLRAENSVGVGEASGTVTATPSASLSILIPEFANQINLYPNPSTDGSFTIVLPQNFQGSDLSIYDSVGRKVYCTIVKTAVNRIDVTPNKSLASGVYIIQLKNEGRIINKKLIVK